MQAQDQRFLMAGQKIKAGQITRFSDIFIIVPKTVLAKVLANNIRPFLPLRNYDLYYFRIDELQEPASSMGAKRCKLLSLVEADMQAEEARKGTLYPATGHIPAFLKKANKAW
ncbi:hypothetical protein V9K67_15485 [Paraflavisolibacter sp. H34]|uniref:hypothetical protein n=1 Tax=Huijunlia imazamoxiresistens TaxID=3127457 RepID=UPI00301773B1